MSQGLKDQATRVEECGMKRRNVSGREVSSPPVPEPEPTVPSEPTVRPDP